MKEKKNKYQNIGSSCLYNRKDYLPCRCLDSDWIQCPFVELSRVEQVFKEPVEIHNLYLVVLRTERLIPAHLLGPNHVEEIIFLQCQKNTQRLAIHPDAFDASRKFSSEVRIKDCNLADFNFSFLKNFRNLDTLGFDLNTNIHLADWESLPPLSALGNLFITNMKLDDWSHFPILQR